MVTAALTGVDAMYGWRADAVLAMQRIVVESALAETMARAAVSRYDSGCAARNTANVTVVALLRGASCWAVLACVLPLGDVRRASLIRRTSIQGCASKHCYVVAVLRLKCIRRDVSHNICLRLISCDTTSHNI